MFSCSTIQTPVVAEYLLLIEPRKDLSNAICEVKQTFYDKYKAPEALKGKPHLTLVKYTQYRSFESRICQRLRNVAIQMSPIAIDLNDYGSFPSHTIFINVVSKTTIQTLVKNIRTQLQNHMKLDKDNKPHFILDPHIIIARRLKPWQYEQGWMEYSTKNFSGRFIASSMILLRKEKDAKQYDLVEKFDFQNLNIRVSQAALF